MTHEREFGPVEGSGRRRVTHKIDLTAHENTSHDPTLLCSLGIWSREKQPNKLTPPSRREAPRVAREHRRLAYVVEVEVEEDEPLKADAAAAVRGHAWLGLGVGLGVGPLPLTLPLPLTRPCGGMP